MKTRIILLLCACLNLSGYSSLHQAQEYANALKKGKRISFDAGAFKKLLSDVVQQQETIGYTGRYLLKLSPFPDTKFVIWGPLKGAFESLVRTLTFGKQQGFINDDFTIVDHSTYLVFNGDVINSAETSLETLSLVLALMKANPKKVFYLKGKTEDALHWQNDGLKLALKQKASNVSQETIPLGSLVARLFDTLPLALYVTGLNPDEGSIRISYFSRDYDEIDELQCGALLTKKTINVPQICYINAPQKGPARVKAIIKSEQRVMSYSQHPGLTMVEPDRGAVAWSIFSAPNKKYQKEYDFYSDALAVVRTGPSIKDAIITLYTNDTRTPDPSGFSDTYNLLTGIKLPHVAKKKKKVPQLSTIQKELQRIYTQIEQLLSEVSHLTNALTQTTEQREQL